MGMGKGNVQVGNVYLITVFQDAGGQHDYCMNIFLTLRFDAEIDLV